MCTAKVTLRINKLNMYVYRISMFFVEKSVNGKCMRVIKLSKKLLINYDGIMT